ncbi:hypothetical protein R1sor_019152 [Riccia sorocarpa]|uniref:NB-ARC domain-containing protein n=1 Tax=Riccia sorocarpa TaxID=122646 RepID=A0ABD3IBQ1_9MARC
MRHGGNQERQWCLRHEGRKLLASLRITFWFRKLWMLVKWISGPAESEHASYDDGQGLNDSLYSWYEPNDPELEIVFFHGLVPTACGDIHRKAWTNGCGECWPEKWLQDEQGFPRARILSVKYDSSLNKTKSAGVYALKLLSETLATDLIDLGNIGQTGRPVVLVSGSFAEATNRCDTDKFLPLLEPRESINKPCSRISSSFQFFVDSVKTFIQFHHVEDVDERFQDFIRENVGLEDSVQQVTSLLASLERAEGGINAVVLHGMGGNKQIREKLRECYKKANRPLLIFIDSIEKEDGGNLDCRLLEEIFPGNINDLLPQRSYILIASRNLKMCTTLQNLGQPSASRLHRFTPKVCSYRVKPLDEHSAEKLFSHHSKLSESRILQTRKDMLKVLDICGGLPLALKVVGAALAETDLSNWSNVLQRLEDCKPVDGTTEDSLNRSLQFSYNQLQEDIQQTFLDIVFCFIGSPWNQLKVLYGDNLNILEQRALIMKEELQEHGSSFSYPSVKVHALFVALGRREGKASGSHISVEGERYLRLQDIDLKTGKGGPVVLVLQGNLSRWHRMKETTGRGGLLQGFLPSCEWKSEWFTRTLRILVLRDLLIQGKFCMDEVPKNLECLLCFNSNLPFQNGNLTSLEKLKYVDILTMVDDQRSYTFPGGVQHLRLQNRTLKQLTFGSDHNDSTSHALKEFGLMSAANLLVNIRIGQLQSLSKLVLTDITGLDNNLPDELFQLKSLQSLSIENCHHISTLPDFYTQRLEHLHLALSDLVELPDTLKSLNSLRFVQTLAMDTMMESPELQVSYVTKWEYYLRRKLDVEFLGESSSAIQMPPLISQVTSSLIQLYAPSPPHSVEMDIIFFPGLQLDFKSDSHLSTWRTGDDSDELWPSWLPSEYPKARILVASYDAWIQKMVTTRRQGLFSFSDTLFDDLCIIREKQGRNCPLILVGHSFGGLVIKKLCVIAEARKDGFSVNPFIQRVQGIFFYATPHIGMTQEFLGEQVIGSMPANERLPIFAKELNTGAARLHEEFLDVQKNYEWKIFGVGETCRNLGIDSLLSALIGNLEQHTFLGLGGAGKTTMAELLFEELEEEFEYTCFVEELKLMTGSKDDFKGKIWTKMRRHGKSIAETCRWDDIRGQKLLMVLDDIDKAKHVDLILDIARDNAMRGSRYITTSRDMGLLKWLDEPQYGKTCICEIPSLKDEDAQRLFYNYTFPNGEKPPETLGGLY